MPLEEWEALGLDPRQWAYDRWWSAPREGEDLQLLVPQPAPPVMDTGSPWWMAMVALGTD